MFNPSFRGRLFAWLAGLVLCCTASAAETSYVTARTTAGVVRGKISADGAVRVFQGIPFAAPPTGELRWKAPRPPVPWTGVRDALAAGSPCPQTGRLASTNEDCLVLNVWAPHKRTGRPLPVMVFLHGGGQVNSAPHEYNADWLVTRGSTVVYVSMNYRLNIFAFFAHKALTQEDPQLGSGNYAALDQIQALRWVRDNIASFGGDPKNVTIFGEFGGGQAVCILLASPPARGLFHKAISQSAPCQWQNYPSLTASEAKGVEIAAELGCTGANPMPCLRALPASAVLARQRGPVTDTAAAQPAWGGGVFPLPIREAVASGRFARVPLMQGSTRRQVTGAGTADLVSTAVPGNAGETFWIDQMYVRYQVPVNARKLPLVLVHGGGGTGEVWETTPDGREGFETIFLRRGFPVYTVDAPRGGRSGFPGFNGQLGTLDASQQVIAPNTSRAGDRYAWARWRMGPRYPERFAVQAFPVEAFEPFMKGVRPILADDPEVIARALVQLLEKIGPAVVVTHSNGGLWGWLAGARSPNVRAIVSYEPTFVFPPGEVEISGPARSGNQPGGTTVTAQEFANLVKMPIQVVFGDNIPKTAVAIQAANGRRLQVADSRLFIEALNKRGGKASVLMLPEVGLRGNSHFAFQDLNNLQVADQLSAFLARHGLDAR